jgi:hypothetical protein
MTTLLEVAAILIPTLLLALHDRKAEKEMHRR